MQSREPYGKPMFEPIWEAAAAHGTRARIHLKVDTGMERIGVHHYNAEGLLEAAARSTHCEVEGIYTHFANADAEDLSHARLQLERFLEALRFYERRSLPVPARHVANSAALLRMPEARLDISTLKPGDVLEGLGREPVVAVLDVLEDLDEGPGPARGPGGQGLEIAGRLGRDVGDVPPEWHRTAEVLKSRPGATVT